MAFALAPPAGGTTASGWTVIPASDAFEDGLMFGDDGPIALLPNHSLRSGAADWLKFQTDACGQLERVDNRRSILLQSALNDLYDFDEDDPSVEAHTIVGQWIATHTEIAVVSDGVDRSCDGNWFDGEGFPPETVARWPSRTVRNTSYIA